MSSEEFGETASIVPHLPGAPEQTYLFPKPKGHSRSVSHGGTPMLHPEKHLSTLAARPVPLKSALRGHQRAFSQGQIVEGAARTASGPGHSRTGSRTDFILPPGHREQPSNNPIAKAGSIKNNTHSRQGSRSDSIYTLRRDSVVGPWRRVVFWVTRKPHPQVDNRNFFVIPNHLVPDKTPPQDHPNGNRKTNKIRTTKYTMLSFIPKNLFEQFHRIANLYFIFVVLLNWVPAINAFGKEVAMLPVLFVLSVTAIKDLFEDRRRHKSDKRINNSMCRVYRGSVDRYVRVKWQDVRVGDIVHLSNNEPVPADMVLLNTSSPLGVCYLDTCNLDGESNLKQRLVAPGFQGKKFNPKEFRSTVEVERPSTKVYRFTGIISHPNGARVALSSDNLLLRECTVKNTGFVEGIVVYAGHETKAMLNNGGPRYKCSKLEKKMNTDIIWCVLVLLFLCCAGAVGCKLWLDQWSHLKIPPPFIPKYLSPAYEGLLIFWTYIIVLQVMIPVSLYVTIELTKLMQVYFINQDIEMYDSASGRRIECRALNITEELGQINYVFSDKTGTLTENKMIFRRCTINGVDYEHPPGEPAEPSTTLPPLVTPITQVSPNRRLLQHVSDENDSQHTQKVREFLFILATCNTVVVSQPHIDTMELTDSITPTTTTAPNGHASFDKYARLSESRSTTPSPPPASAPAWHLAKLKRLGGRKGQGSPISNNSDAANLTRYEAESPDELALAEAALAYGYELRSRTPDSLELGVRGDLRCVRVLRVQHFDAARKCMSVAFQLGSQVVLYVKGADTSIFPALSPLGAGSAEAAAYERTKALLDEYSHGGLRTLVMAKRVMTPAAFEAWQQEHLRVSAMQEGRERRIRESISRLESDLTLIGATGVEDRLQEDVPVTIRALLDAGIVVWVLTGDKPETAINVAYSAALFSQLDQLLYLMSRDKAHAESTIQGYLSSGVGGEGGRACSLVVDGRTLTYILDRRSGLVAPFLSLARRCSSVLCCRATPLQKAYIVKAVKEELGVTTLAIGDGANDVSMIQTADVGIGLSGQEGRQAVMASDFALSRFKYLKRLLLIHGHWNYDRLARLIMYFIVKNTTFVFLVFWYQLYSGFSAAVGIDQLHVMGYNLCFTAMQPLIIGTLERVAPAKLLSERPDLYSHSGLGLTYHRHAYWLLLCEAIYMSAVIFFITSSAFWNSDVDHRFLGVVNMTCVLILVVLYAALETRSWTVPHVCGFVFSLALYFGLTLAFQAWCVVCLGLPSTFRVLQDAATMPAAWLALVVVLVAALAPRLFIRGIRGSLLRCELAAAAAAARRRRPAFAAHYRCDTNTTHLYRRRDEDSAPKEGARVAVIT